MCVFTKTYFVWSGIEISIISFHKNPVFFENKRRIYFNYSIIQKIGQKHIIFPLHIY